MKLKDGFEIVDLSDESLLIPIGSKADQFKGLIALNDEAAYLLKHLNEPRTSRELVELLMDTYVVNEDVAVADVASFIGLLNDYGVLE